MDVDFAKADLAIQVSLAETFIQPATLQSIIRHCFSRKNRMTAGGAMVTLLIVTLLPKVVQFDVVWPLLGSVQLPLFGPETVTLFEPANVIVKLGVSKFQFHDESF